MLNADQQLNGYDFRAENALLATHRWWSGAGRGARGQGGVADAVGKDPSWAAARQDYELLPRGPVSAPWATALLRYTRVYGFGEDELKTLAAADEVKNGRGLEALGVIGPAPLPVYRLNGKYRLRITVKTRETKRLRDAAAGILKEFMSSKRFAGCRLKPSLTRWNKIKG